MDTDGRQLTENSETGDPVDAVYGSLDLKESTDAIIRELRGTPDAG